MFLNLTLGYLLFTALYVVCFALGLTVCGLYGHDLTRAREAGVAADSKWVYAVVVGALSAATCAVYMVPLVLRHANGIFGLVIAGWNAIIFVLWVAVFGVFGDMYINENPEGDGAIERMRNAVWIDLTNMLLWLIATAAALGYWWRHRTTRTRFTGRAHV